MRILCSRVFKPLWLLVGGLAYLLIRLAEPWRRIEADLLVSDRIGHICAFTDLYLRRRFLDAERARSLPILFSGVPANRQLLEMIKRKLRVVDSALPTLLYKLGLRPWIEGTRFDARICDFGINNAYDEFNNAPPQLSFLPDELERGKRLLAEIGVPAGKPFVCFSDRDAAYLVSAHRYRSAEEWAYHNYRNCSVDNYLPAAEALAESGLAAIRMGHIVEKAVRSKNRFVIDYAREHRSDFGDVSVMAQAKFYLGNTSGLNFVAWAFGIPVAHANLVPIGYPPLRACDLYIPKRFRHAARGRCLTFRELIAMGADLWDRGEQYAEAGVEVVENTAEDILDLALEMNQRLDGTWKPDPEDEELQERYRSLWPADRKARNCPARIGTGFLRKNRSLLE